MKNRQHGKQSRRIRALARIQKRIDGNLRLEDTKKARLGLICGYDEEKVRSRLESEAAVLRSRIGISEDSNL
jgi:hypothetical protein